MANLDYRLTIKVDGKPFADTDLDDLINLTVDTDYFLPAMFDITLEDRLDAIKDMLQYTDGVMFKIGGQIVISVEAALDVENSKYSGMLIDGEITSLEPQFGSDGRALLHVRGYDRAHKLLAGEMTHVYGSGAPGSITEQMIITKVCQAAGLTAQVDASGLSGASYPYVLQYAQTDWDFLWERARRVGYQVYIDGKKLVFSKANVERGVPGLPVELEWGKDLTSFEPRLSVTGQATEALVTSWDPSTKKKVVAKCISATLSTAPATGLVEKPPQATKKLYSQAPIAHTDEPGLTASTAKLMADADLSALSNNSIQASGFLQNGDPRVLAGHKIKIKGVGKHFTGTYYVTRARHTLSRGEYTVEFDVSGATPHTLSGLLNAGREAANGRKLYGPVVGIVTNISDPQKLGRVQVKFPWLPDDGGVELQSNWARLASPGAGKDRGLIFMPEVNDEVLVVFEHGDVNTPYVLGGLWNKMDLLPAGTGATLANSQGVNQRVICSRTGHLIVLNDTAGGEQILIQDNTAENSILIDTAKKGIIMKSKADFTIEAGGNFVVKAQGSVTLEATNSFEITTKKNFAVSAVQEAAMKASNNQVVVSSSGAELSGLTVDVKASTKLSVTGSAMAEIKGGIVKIN